MTEETKKDPAPDLTEHHGLMRIGDTVGRGDTSRAADEKDEALEPPLGTVFRVGDPCGSPVRSTG